MLTTVKTPEELKEALRDNCANLYLGSALYFERPEQAINVSEVYKGSNAISIRGAGGAWIYDGSVLEKLYDGGPPLLTFEHDRDWELRFAGFILSGNYKRGLAFDIGYCQQSVFDDLRIQGFGSGAEDDTLPPFVACAPASTWNFLQLCWNKRPAQIKEATNVKITGKSLFQTDWQGRNSGCVLTAQRFGPNSFNQGCVVDDLHNEGCDLIFRGYKRACGFTGGYYFTSQVAFEDCEQPTWDTRFTVWEGSSLFVNGKKVDPMSSGFLSRFL